MGDQEELIHDIKKRPAYQRILRKYLWNRYVLAAVIFLVWMIFFDNTSWLVLRELNEEIDKYSQQVEYYKKEYERNDAFYQKLMNDKNAKEKFARENYFMKKPNEEIFILVVDSAKTSKP